MGQRETAAIIIQIRGGLKAAAEARAVADGMDELGDQTRQSGEEALGAAAAFNQLQRQLHALARAEALASIATGSMTLAMTGMKLAALGLAALALPALIVAFGQVGAAALIWSTVLIAGMGGVLAAAGLLTAGVIGRFKQMKDVVGSAAYDLVGAVGALKQTFIEISASGADRVIRAIADALTGLLPLVRSLGPSLTSIADATATMFRSLGREIAGMGPELRALLGQVPAAISALGDFAGGALRLFLNLATVGMPLAISALQVIAGLVRDVADWFTPDRYQGAVSTLKAFATAVGTFFAAAAAPLKGVLGPGISEFGRTFMASLKPLGLIVGTILATFVQLGRAVLPAVGAVIKVIAGAIAKVGPALARIDVGKIGQFLAGGVRGIASVLAKVIPGLIQFGKELLDAIKPAAPLVTNVIWPLAKGIGEGLLGAIKSLIPIVKLVASVLGWLGTKAKPLRGVFENIGKVIGFLAAGPILKGIGALSKFDGVLGVIGKGAKLLGKVFEGIGWVIGKAAGVLVSVGRGAVATARYLTYFADVLQGGVRGAVRIYATVLTKIVGFYASIPGRIASAVGKLPDLLKGLGGKLLSAGKTLGGKLKDGILGGLKAMVRGFATVWNNTVGQIHFKIPGWIPKLGGKSFGIPKINADGLASGGTVMTAGSVWVGERGPELLNLPAGSHVMTAAQTAVAATVRHTPITPRRMTASATDGRPTQAPRVLEHTTVLKLSNDRELARVVDRVHLDDDGRNT